MISDFTILKFTIPDSQSGRTYFGRGTHPAGSKSAFILVVRGEKRSQVIEIYWKFRACGDRPLVRGIL
jgi:hypothetical protein